MPVLPFHYTGFCGMSRFFAGRIGGGNGLLQICRSNIGKRADNLAVKALVLHEQGNGFFGLHARAVGTWADHGAEGVDHGQNARIVIDGLPGQMLGQA